MPDAELTAVVSRSADRAAAFAAEHGATASGTDLTRFLGDVDVLYVATPHIAHADPAITALDAGVAVLCEKPLTVSAAESRRVVEAAQRSQTFLMEAMWMRFIPAIVRATDLVAEGRIGEVRSVEASFSVVHDFPAHHRLVNRSLGGGATLDLGVYPLNLAHLFLGPPTHSHVMGRVEGGVDVHAEVLAEHATGWSRTVSSLTINTTNEAVVWGTEGRITFHRPHHHTTRLTVERSDGGTGETIDLPYPGTGFEFQVAEVHRCLAEGLVESPVVPHRATLDVATWMDDILGSLGVAYS